MTQPNRNGRVLYEGPSMLDGELIVVVVTGFLNRTANAKTGDMLQTWILRQDTDPHHAYTTEAGASVCGDCPHRLNQTCYVSWWRAPTNVWRAWRRGAYPPAQPSDFYGVTLRLGSAGDPAAVPPWVWAPILPHLAGRTGYTHQWRSPIGAWLRGIVQASCDSLQDLADARAAGWRTFTVLPLGEPDPGGTTHCAASTERGHATTCAQCRLCDGASADVAITAHGVSARRILFPNELTHAPS